MSPTKESVTIRQGLSTRESRLLARLAGAGHQIISVNDIERTLKVAPNSAREIASRLTKKGWLDRLFPGRYLIIPLAAGEEGLYTTHEYLIASHVAEPMYVGYYTALDHHGLTEQVPRTVYVVTPTRAQSREIHGVPYRVVTVTERKFFGYEPTSIEGSAVNVADIRKTLVDCADHPEFGGGIRELAQAMVAADDRDCSWTTVGEYLQRLDNGAATKRIVFLADELDIDLPTRETLLESFTSGYSLLDPTRSEQGRYDSEYRLRINVDRERFSSMES
jgi:predicted transcriptional regulator of viral defense system